MAAHCEVTAAAQADPQLVSLIAALLRLRAAEPGVQHSAEAEAAKFGGCESSGDETTLPLSGRSTSGSDNNTPSAGPSRQTTGQSSQTSEGAPPADLETLRTHGEMWSKGSEDHPGGCRPCAFSCFRRGCTPCAYYFLELSRRASMISNVGPHDALTRFSGAKNGGRVEV